MGREVGVLCPFLGSWIPIEHNVAWADAYLRTNWHLHPSSRLATTDMDRKLGGGCAFWPLDMGRREGAAGPHLTQCSLGRDLLPY